MAPNRAIHKRLRSGITVDGIENRLPKPDALGATLPPRMPRRLRYTSRSRKPESFAGLGIHAHQDRSGVVGVFVFRRRRQYDVRRSGVEVRSGGCIGSKTPVASTTMSMPRVRLRSGVMTSPM
jgi:hypothetical protein